ncbi:aspartate aminotransferase family protein [Haliscomenobacter hydrossis]|uniref:Acetylornithine transaminase n=1 Tax=Haliscomenobacter hydrossis (strain ATCC 27775 / DSM 1100 / LMG 10767 / O) TaxID=760192 RepID=F4KTS1_HALH1|nr:aspartate aminotransferase family protein [Haliscomenobacter hydrossis]AEE48065.1 Acetylornithine transaminase [Haliscomenobacter hydrossis DSM 1100]
MSTPVNQGENIRSLRAETTSSDFTNELIARDSSVFFHQTLSSPVFNVVTKAEGAYIYDGEGKKYLDLHGNGVHTAGYNNPQVIAAIQKQITESLTFAPRRFTNLPAVALAEKLVEIAPEGLNRVLFCPGGSEAIEMAVMLAKLYTGKWKTLSYYGSFHGAGFQAVSIGADAHFREGLGPMMPGAIHLELPDYYRNPWGWTDQQQIDDEYLRQLSTQIAHNPEIAALITEPIFYNSTVPTRYYWEQVKAICKVQGILLIFDEIYTAFGRTGKMFAAEHFIPPDIIVIGKGFGGGIVPFAGIIGREELNVLEHKSIGHYTHEKNPLCAAVAKAVIDYVETEQLVAHAQKLGQYFRSGLEALQHEFALIGNISGLGLNLAVDLVKDRQSKARATEEAQQLMAFCMNRGISFKLIQGNILNLKPALVITQQEIDLVLETLREGLRALN